jgi:hypothetical protein
MPIPSPNLSHAPGNDADEVPLENNPKAIVDVTRRRSASR